MILVYIWPYEIYYLVFAFGKCFTVLATARALQGITSACFTIGGNI